MKESLFICLFLFTINYCLTQEKEIKGKIYLENNQSLENAYISNITNKHSTYTNINGEFLIKLNINDSIKIEHPSIKAKTFKIAPLEYYSSKLSILVESNINELEEIVIQKKLTGVISLDVKNYIQTPQKDLENLIGVPNNKNTKQRKSDEPLFTTILPNPFAIYDILSGNKKRRHDLYKYEDKHETITKIKEYFSTKFFVEDLQIPESNIQNFIEYTYEVFSLESKFKQKNYVAIIQDFEKSSIIYRKRLDFISP